ncbi:MAG: signal peptide peptidase SppA [Anaerolineales bacterium]|nr:signal peptide peptidase SppA [Anaerolineales bacterium]
MGAGRLIRNGLIGCRNGLRSMRRGGLEWIVLPVEGAYPEFPPPAPSLPFPFNRLVPVAPGASVEAVRVAADRLASDRRVRGVVLQLDGLHDGLTAMHGLRSSVQRLRDAGKRVVAWLSGGSMGHYYLAAACDEIIMPPSARLMLLGLRAEVTFLKETLAQVGVEADLESIGEYKTAPDTFRRVSMSEPHRRMLEAVLDGYMDEFAAAIADGRGLAPAEVRARIGVPLTSGEALEAGLIDAVLYEDELPAHLLRARTLDAPEAGVASRSGLAAARRGRAQRLTSWHDANRWLPGLRELPARPAVGVVSVEGMIVPGKSRRVPFPLPIPITTTQAGADTVIQALRRAEDDDRLVAVILLVDSPGGSALASDLIAREVHRLRQRKPVVALLGDQAASGGYYVAAPANVIVARPTTLTGSIGIWGGKFVMAGLYERLLLRRELVQRGAMAGLHSEMAPFSEEERAWVRRDMGEAYARFVTLVGEGRGMPVERVEQIARGRVWIGAQAREQGLVDELGGFETALAQAKALVGVDDRARLAVVQVTPPKQLLTAAAFTPKSAAWETMQELLQVCAVERTWAMAPWGLYVRH